MSFDAALASFRVFYFFHFCVIGGKGHLKFFHPPITVWEASPPNNKVTRSSSLATNKTHLTKTEKLKKKEKLKKVEKLPNDK